MMRKLKVSFRIEAPIIDDLKGIAVNLGWTMSQVLRYMITVSYCLLRPDVTVDINDLIRYIKKNECNGKIATWKLVKFLAPKAVERIEELEKMQEREDGS